jgi:hypothetical protein
MQRIYAIDCNTDKLVLDDGKFAAVAVTLVEACFLSRHSNKWVHTNQIFLSGQ